MAEDELVALVLDRHQLVDGLEAPHHSSIFRADVLVVVAQNKVDLAVESAQDAELVLAASPGPTDVSEVVDGVLGADDSIPAADEHFIVLLSSIKGAGLLRRLSGAGKVGVPEVGIGGKEKAHTIRRECLGLEGWTPPPAPAPKAGLQEWRQDRFPTALPKI